MAPAVVPGRARRRAAALVSAMTELRRLRLGALRLPALRRSLLVLDAALLRLDEVLPAPRLQQLRRLGLGERVELAGVVDAEHCVHQVALCAGVHAGAEVAVVGQVSGGEALRLRGRLRGLLRGGLLRGGGLGGRLAGGLGGGHLGSFFVGKLAPEIESGERFRTKISRVKTSGRFASLDLPSTAAFRPGAPVVQQPLRRSRRVGHSRLVTGPRPRRRRAVKPAAAPCREC